MKFDTRRALMGLLVGLMGMTILATYFGVIDLEVTGIQGLGQATAGFVFVMAGGWLFYQAVVPPEMSELPAYVWTQYIFISLLLVSFAVTFLWAGWKESDWTFMALGAIPLLIALWYIVMKFPSPE